ncbi:MULTISPECIES: glycoside hydrolase family 26 protein [Streptomyces]|uniref:glycoside hydrolase family 26 protein n=1 Tax=Streptomyces TaxID=1883 RepID=UPI001F526E7C|nr:MULTISPECIES: glycosyl hydrolase [Streptomyces]
MVLRPFHENSGSWFWWGAAHASPTEYVELFRDTVEYLRDTQHVHNLLCAYSPGSGYGGSDDVFLRTYPGDDFVDVLGIDSYDDSNASQQYLDGVVPTWAWSPTSPRSAARSRPSPSSASAERSGPTAGTATSPGTPTSSSRVTARRPHHRVMGREPCAVCRVPCAGSTVRAPRPTRPESSVTARRRIRARRRIHARRRASAPREPGTRVTCAGECTRASTAEAGPRSAAHPACPHNRAYAARSGSRRYAHPGNPYRTTRHKIPYTVPHNPPIPPNETSERAPCPTPSSTSHRSPPSTSPPSNGRSPP